MYNLYNIWKYYPWYEFPRHERMGQLPVLSKPDFTPSILSVLDLALWLAIVYHTDIESKKGTICVTTIEKPSPSILAE